ncbi:MAG: hypothetical protein WC516_00385 [Patescibacteria group bacterium]
MVNFLGGKKPSLRGKLCLFVVFLFSVAFFAPSVGAVWQEPSQDPPNGNIPAPINQGAEPQTKTGGLTVPVITSTQLCLTGGTPTKCITNWSSSTLPSGGAVGNMLYYGGAATGWLSTSTIQVSGNNTISIKSNLFLASSTPPASTGSKLYNYGGNLYWNGLQLTGAGGATMPGGDLGQTLHYNSYPPTPGWEANDDIWSMWGWDRIGYNGASGTINYLYDSLNKTTPTTGGYFDKVAIFGYSDGLDVRVKQGDHGVSGYYASDPAQMNSAGHFQVGGMVYGSEVYLALSPYQVNISHAIWARGYDTGIIVSGGQRGINASGVVGTLSTGSSVGVIGIGIISPAGADPDNWYAGTGVEGRGNIGVDGYGQTTNIDIYHSNPIVGVAIRGTADWNSYSGVFRDGLGVKINNELMVGADNFLWSGNIAIGGTGTNDEWQYSHLNLWAGDKNYSNASGTCSNGPCNYYWDIGHRKNDPQGYFSDHSLAFQVRDNNNSWKSPLRLEANGSVGVGGFGTSSKPSAPLHIKARTQYPGWGQLVIEPDDYVVGDPYSGGGSATGIRIQSKPGDWGGGGGWGLVAGTGGAPNVQDLFRIFSFASNTERMVVYPNGFISLNRPATYHRGTYSTIMGSGNSDVRSTSSVALGSLNLTLPGADYSLNSGYDNDLLASSTYSGAIGYGLSLNSPNALAIGTRNKTKDNALFVVGNGANSSNLADAFVIDKNGNVGIGGLSADKLGISGSTTAALRGVIYNSNSSGSSVFRLAVGTTDYAALIKLNGSTYPSGVNPDTNANTLLISAPSKDISFFNNGVAITSLMIKSTGNVGIGVNAPTAKLDVGGVVKVGSFVSSSAPACNANTAGGIYFNSASKKFWGCNGSFWKQLDN